MDEKQENEMSDYEISINWVGCKALKDKKN